MVATYLKYFTDQAKRTAHKYEKKKEKFIVGINSKCT